LVLLEMVEHPLLAILAVQQLLLDLHQMAVTVEDEVTQPLALAVLVALVQLLVLLVEKVALQITIATMEQMVHH
jgi:hypothetical protein